MSLGGKKLKKKDQLAVALSGIESKVKKTGRSLINRVRQAAKFEQPSISKEKD